MYCSLPGSYVHEILQARILEWIAISSSFEITEGQKKGHTGADKGLDMGEIYLCSKKTFGYL